MATGGWKDWIRRWAAAIAVSVMIIGGLGIASAMIFGGFTRSDRPAAGPSTNAPPAPKVPTPIEFAIRVVVTKQDCAPPGDTCVYTYTIEPNYIGNHPLPAHEFTVQYQVTGGTQPQDGDFSVHGDKATFIKDQTVEGPPGAQLKAAATNVIAAPIVGPTAPAPSAQP